MITQSAGTASRAFFTRLQQHLFVTLCGVILAAFSPHRGSAQQVTYYDFNGPQGTPSQVSTACPSNSAPFGVLFCFNYAAAISGNVGASFVQDNSYTTSIDPNETNGTAYALQLTQNAQDQDSSVWYAIPQDVVDGFTVWYTFKITNSAYPPGDGLAFVIQNAIGSGSDADPYLSITGSVESGSGLTVLGASGGGTLGYGGIDNSIALEADTFPDSYDPWDSGEYDYYDNHMALQSCGLDGIGNPIENSPAHYLSNTAAYPSYTATSCLVPLNGPGGVGAIASNPPASSGSGAVTVRDGNPHQVVVVYNGPSDSPANYLYVYLDPTFNPGTHTPAAGSTPLFSGPFNITQYMNLSGNGPTNNQAYLGFTAATGEGTEQHEIMGFSFASHTAPTANVCPSGQTTPAPCNAAMAVTFNVPTTITSVQVVTQGATGLDFTEAGSGDNCVNASSGSCTVNVTFAPLSPGLRTGAVELFSGTTIVATQLISGIGDAPQAVFGPMGASEVGGGLVNFNHPKGVAVDAAGDVFIADTGNARVVEIAPNSTLTIFGPNLPTPLQSPQGLAVDGAGNLFIADNNLNAVVEIPPGCNSTCAQEQILANPLSLTSQLGVAVDGAGDLFVSDYNDGEVAEVPANGSAQTVVYNPKTGSNPVSGSEPVGLAADGAGDLFVADYGRHAVIEVPTGCSSAACQILIGSGWSQPEGVAVDAAGDLYVADAGLNEVVEVPAGCASSSCQIVAASSTQIGQGSHFQPFDVKLDGRGDIYIANYGDSLTDEISQQYLDFVFQDTTPIGGISGDSPQSGALQNIGNQTLNSISLSPFIGLFNLDPTDFVQVPGSGTLANCAAPFSLAPGGACDLSISFEPQSYNGTNGAINAALYITDNSLNSSLASQVLNLEGYSAAATGSTYTLALSGNGSGTVISADGSINCSLSSGSASGQCSRIYASANSLTLTATPAAGSPFNGWGGACASAGTNPTCVLTLSATTSVTASFGSLTEYMLTVTDIGSGSGTVQSGDASINCISGSSSGCSSSYPGGQNVTLSAASVAGSTFVGWGGACATAGVNPTCIVPVNAAASVTATFSQQSFGGVSVCPGGSSAQCTPANLAVTFNIAVDTTLGVTQVVTQGVTGLDFALGSGGTCTGQVSAGSSCTVNVTFTPLAPGLRMGAVNLFDINGNLLATAPIYGTGQGPAIAFGPGTQTPLPASVLAGASGAAVDAAGDVFISDNAGAVKFSPYGVQTTVPVSGVSGAYDVAVDGAGDVFLADTGNNRVVEVAPSGLQTTVPATGLSSPTGVAVDGAGDVFITDRNNNRVVEVTPSGVQTTVPTSGVSYPYYPALDAAGNLYFLDAGNERVLKVTPGGVQSTVPISGLAAGNGVAVDAAGDVFVSDQINNVVLEVTPSGVQTTVPTSGLNIPAGVAVDAAGDIFIAVNGQNRAVEISRSQLPSLSFAVTNVSSTSADSPQAVSIQNVGNQPLTGSLTLNLGANFTQNSTPDCSAEFPLAPGSICIDSFSFTPQTTGYLTGTASFSDNTLNLSPLVVLQTINLSGVAGATGQTGTILPNLVGMTEAAAATALANAGLTLGAVSSEYSSSEPAGSVVGQSPAAGTQANLGAAVSLMISTGEAPPPASNPLTIENNYFVTGDYATSAVTLVGTGVGGIATGTITIPDLTTCGCSQGVPDGADIVDGFLYWTTVENTPQPSANTGTFLGYSITGQQLGSDVPYTDPVTGLSGTLRVYRADVNTYFQSAANGSGVRIGSGQFTVTLPDKGKTGQLPITAGASLVVIYRVLSPNFPLKAVVIYDGSTVPASSTTQSMQGFYDAVGGASGSGESTPIYYSGAGTWNGSTASVALGASDQYNAPLNAGNAYAAEIVSTPVNNSDNDGILDAWKAGPASGFFAGQPGYYDVKTQSWVPLPGAKHGNHDLFVQLDWMCGNVLASGACDPSQENLFPSPDPDGNDPLAMVQQAFAQTGITLHLQVGNAVPESTCTDNTSTVPAQLCQFPSEPGVIGWKNSLEFSKLWPRNFNSCAAGGDCTTRFPYGQKDSYHYVLFGHSLAIPAWNTPYGSLTAISTNPGAGQTTISTTNRGAEGSINYCPSRFTLSGVLSYPGLNGVYNTVSCPDANTIILATPGVSTWSYSYATNTPPEPEIGLTSGTVTSISGYSDLGGADSAVTLALWETAPNQDMSKRAQVVAGTLYHEIGHTLGLSHGGLYYDAAPSYVPTFEANCKPNYQSVMNYLFQLDGVGPNAAIAYSNQQLDGEPQTGTPATLSQASFGLAYQLTDPVGNAATFPTSSWYTPNAPSTATSPATLHCDGSPLTGDTGYRVTGSIAPITPAWANGQNITFDGVPYTTLRGYNDAASLDLRQVGATGGEFASLASVLSFGNSSAPLSVAAGGSVAVGAGGTVTLGAGGNMTLSGGGNVTVGSGAVISNTSTITFGTGGSATLNSGDTVTPGSNGVVTLPNGGAVTLSGPGTITLGAGGNITLGAGLTATLGAGGTISLIGGGTVTIPSTGGSYTLPADGGTITLPAGGNVTLGAGGLVTLGAGGNVTLGAGHTATLGAGGLVTLGAGGNVTLGAGHTATLSSGGNITLGAGGNIALGAGGTVTLGAGGNVTLGAGGLVALGAGGNVTLGAGGNVTLGAGGNVTLGAGHTATLSSGGTVTLGAGGLITLGAGGTVIPSGGTAVTLGAGGSYTLPAGGGTVTLGAGGNITLGAGGNITLGAGVNVTLGAGGVVALGAGGNVTLGAGHTTSLGAGGNITLGAGGATSTEMDYNTANSVVRPPPSATYTVTGTNNVQVNWKAPAFGVVQAYTISRSVITPPATTPGAAVVIGTVSGVGGYPPATTFIDTNPPTSGTLVYTIATTLVPDAPASTPRQSAPSPPAVLTLGQTIVLGPLPSSVLISTSQITVTATAESTLGPNGLQVSFSATDSCSIVSGSQSVTPVSNGAGGVSSATVALNGTGTCSITASQAGDGSTAQAGTTAYNVAEPVSAAFAIVAQNSSATPQAIAFPQLSNVQYGSGFSVSASSSSGLTVSFSSSGPCTLSNVTTVDGTTTAIGATTGAGLCMITASAPSGSGSNSSTYSAASVSQSFSVYQAVISVTAASFTVPYGQSLPTLTYTLSGFVNNDPATVVTGTPSLSTTATSASNPSFYPITVATGSLAAANYSFAVVPGTLTIQLATPTVSISNIPSSAIYGGSFTPMYSYSGNGSPAESTASSTTGVCTVSSGTVRFVGAGICTLTASATATTDYAAATGSAQSFTVSQATPTISITNIPTSAVYGGSFTPMYSYSGNGSPAESTASSTSSVCTVSGSTVSFVGAGICTLTASATATTDYAAATGSAQSFTVSQATATISITNIPSKAAYGGSFTPAYSYSGNGSPTESAVSSTSSVCTVSGSTVRFVGAGICTLTASATATTDYAAATGSAQSFTVGQAAQAITFTTNPPATAAYKSTFTVAATGGASGNPVTFASSGACSNSGATFTMTNSTGTCSVIANQAGNTDYSAAPQLTKTVTATGPAVAVSPSSINFGTLYLGGVSTQNVTVTNTGTASVTINQPLLSIVQGGNSSEFIAANLCPTPLAAGKSCTITIAFVAGPYYTAQTATLEIMDNAPGSPQPVTLSAMVIDPLASFNPASLAFGTIKHATSSTLNVTLTNTGATALIFSGAGISVKGTNATDFVETNNCASSLAAGAKCTIAVKFTPPATGTFSASLTVVDNAKAGSGTQTVSLSGTGN